MPCSLCKAEGHNARTCSGVAPNVPQPDHGGLRVVSPLRLPAVVYQVSPTLWRAECPFAGHSVVHGKDRDEAVGRLMDDVKRRGVRPEIAKAEFFEVIL